MFERRREFLIERLRKRLLAFGGDFTLTSNFTKT